MFLYTFLLDPAALLGLVAVSAAVCPGILPDSAHGSPASLFGSAVSNAGRYRTFPALQELFALFQDKVDRADFQCSNCLLAEDYRVVKWLLLASR